MDTLSLIKEILLFVILILFQVLLFSRIALFGVAIPLIYIYYLIKLPIGRNHLYVIVSSFLMGFIIDLFMNTPGINAVAITTVAAIRSIVLKLFYEKVDFEDHIPSIYNFTASFIKYSITIILVHQFVLFFTESLVLFNLKVILTRISSSVLLTFMVIIALDALNINKKQSIG